MELIRFSRDSESLVPVRLGARSRGTLFIYYSDIYLYKLLLWLRIQHRSFLRLSFLASNLKHDTQ
jgi:hypothetical protein